MPDFDDLMDWREDFVGHQLFSATAGSNVGHQLLIADTSSAGTPTYTVVDGSDTGELSVAFDATSEVQNVCVYMGDNLCFDANKLVDAYFRVKMNQAAVNAATSFAIGLTSDRNDTIDTLTEQLLFRVVGADSTTNLVVESDDGSTDNNDIATATTLINAYKTLKLDFSGGPGNIKYWVKTTHTWTQVASGTTFSMTNYAGSLQFFAQIQKTASTNTDGFTIDYARVRCRR